MATTEVLPPITEVLPPTTEVLPPTTEVLPPTTEVLLTDVLEVFRCCACHVAPLLPPVFCCRLGHCVCASCQHIVQNQCTECSESLSGRNLPLEEILLSALFNEHEELTTLDEEQKEEDSLVLHRKAQTLEHLESVVANDCHVQLLTGGRTVQCPFPCQARVTAPGLYRHFGFQHPEVFVGMLCKNHPCTVAVPRDCLAGLDQQTPSRCVYIFVVDIGDGAQREEDKLTALNSMNAAELLNITHSMRYMLRRQKYLAVLSVGRVSEAAYSAWVTALYHFTPVSYTLSFSCGAESVSYQGRPRGLHGSADSGRDCLVLPSALLRRRVCSEGLELTVTFHLDLPFPQGYPTDKEPEVEPEPVLCDL